jgi:hypothetical protein
LLLVRDIWGSCYSWKTLSADQQVNRSLRVQGKETLADQHIMQLVTFTCSIAGAFQPGALEADLMGSS